MTTQLFDLNIETIPQANVVYVGAPSVWMNPLNTNHPDSEIVRKKKMTYDDYFFASELPLHIHSLLGKNISYNNAIINEKEHAEIIAMYVANLTRIKKLNPGMSSIVKHLLRNHAVTGVKLEVYYMIDGNIPIVRKGQAYPLFDTESNILAIQLESDKIESGYLVKKTRTIPMSNIMGCVRFQDI